MSKIEDILRNRHSGGLNISEIVASVGTSRGTVSHVLKRARAAGISWPLPDGVDRVALRDIIYPAPPRPADAVHLQPDWPEIVKELARHDRPRSARVTRLQLWREYCMEAEDQGLRPYGRSQFYALLSDHLSGPGAPPEMRFTYLPGEYALSDYSGKSLGVTTPQGLKMVEVFVCVLGCSRLIFATATEDQTLRSWTDAHQQAFSYFKGQPSKLVIDNLKSGVTKWHKEDPMLNDTFADFARHHDLAVLPARPGRPRDKGIVENAVKAVQSRILVPLRHETFISLADMKRALRTGLDELNAAPMADHGASRIELFETEKKEALKPLPAHPWEYAESVRRKVGRDYHVKLGKNKYSVPHRLIGATVRVRHSEHTVEVFDMSTGERVATHPRQSVVRRLATRADHMPEAHLEMQHRRSPEYELWLRCKLRAVGPVTDNWAGLCIESRDFPEHAYQTLRSAISLAEKHGSKRVEASCTAAVAQGRFSYAFLRDWLKTAPPLEDDTEPLRPHRYLRGPDYYANQSRKENN